MSAGVVRVSLLDDLRFNLFHVLPMFAQGLFTRSRFWVGVVSRYHPDPAGVRFAGRLRAKYCADFLRLHMLATPTVLVLDPDGIRRVLHYSPTVYADPRSKRKGMSHFQPGAVTISRGADWSNRRKFNEAVLQPGRLHELADRFLAVVRDEVAKLGRTTLTWASLEELFARLTRRVVLGDKARDDVAVTALQDRLMRQSNRLVGLHRNDTFRCFYERLRPYLEAPEPMTLAALCRTASSDERTRVENQVPHWIFAMKDTLAINTVYALALVGANPSVQKRLRGEFPQSKPVSAAEIHGCRYLEGCVQEAMRLWPTTPMLLRETVCAERLGGQVFPPGTQVLVWNPFNHRDRRATVDADRFRPERWADSSVNEQFNHLSNGPQGCAGKSLALFLGSAVLAELLGMGNWIPSRDPYGEDGSVVAALDPFRTTLSGREVAA